MSPKNSDLSRDAIVDRALAIADAEGIAAITVRRIAKEFGVTPMALYWHVANKDELFAAMGDRFFDGLELPVEGEWSERLRVVTDRLVAALRRHPGSAHLALTRVLACPAGRDLSEPTFAMLRAAGFSVRQTADIARTAIQTAMMLVTQEAGAEVGVGAECREEVAAEKRRAIKSLPAARYPTLVECADTLTETDDHEEYYRFGVDLYISGVLGLYESLAGVGAQSPA
ncbi:MAG TPA: TetR family transcriptional regulator [Jatrophihabitans sp.]|uniref:TetR/AcrR family transcriptional regulator C-terminal domain-containing protein n=1 Tax=Jatrophihabitans sp. TaxID=1932789 RepID=UPI002E00AE39|nr:TetR family transcriptional regulator [Jatrophihabitans sp.]